MTPELLQLLQERKLQSSVFEAKIIDYVIDNQHVHDSIMKATYAFHMPSDRFNPSMKQNIRNIN